LTRRRTAFWITSEFFGSIIPSTIHARDAAIKSANPHTVVRAFQFAATMAAAIIVGGCDRSQHLKAHSPAQNNAAQGRPVTLDLRTYRRVIPAAIPRDWQTAGATQAFQI